MFFSKPKKKLKELAKEMSKEVPNCPKELNLYLKQGDYQAVLEKDRILTKDTKHILHLLEEELGKSNKTVDWFMKEFKDRV